MPPVIPFFIKHSTPSKRQKTECLTFCHHLCDVLAELKRMDIDNLKKYGAGAGERFPGCTQMSIHVLCFFAQKNTLSSRKRKLNFQKFIWLKQVHIVLCVIIFRVIKVFHQNEKRATQLE